MATTSITARDLSGMLTHWLSTPVNGYLGSSYGSDIKSLIQTPMAAGLADGLIAKARQDIPLLLSAPADMVNVYSRDIDLDKKEIVFEVAGELVPVDGGSTSLQDNTPPVDFTVTPIDTVNQATANLLHTNVHVTMPTTDYF